jgi:ATP-dependent Clp protease adaptor protein ClpS
MPTKRQDAVVLEPKKTAAVPPPMYKVLLLNDDFTPMEFVIEVLVRFFGMDGEKATTVMLKVHNEGAGVAGVYPRDIAETKVNQVIDFAREHQHPLQCVMEENQ